MPVILHILFFKVRIFFKLSAELSAKNLIKHLGSLIVFGGFAVGAFLFARVLTEYLLVKAHLGLFLLHRFLSMLLFVFFLSVNVGNIIVSYATFYRSRETEFFLTKPVSHTTVFIIRFLDNFFYSSTVLFIVVVAVVLGYGSYFSMPALFYLRAIALEFIPFMLIAGCLAVITLMFLMRVAPRFGIWKVIGVLLVFTLGVLFLYFRSTNPMQMVDSVMQHYPRVDQYFAGLDPPFAKFLPNQWIAESFYWTARGEHGLALQFSFFTTLISAAAFLGMVLTAERLFYGSWLSSLAVQRPSQEGRSMFEAFSLTQPSSFDPQTSVILRKEFWQFIREPSQWIHFGVIGLLVLTFVGSISSLKFETPLPFYLTASYLTLLVFNVFLVSSVALRFVFPMISVEGQSFWSMLSAPISRTKIYFVKLAIALVPLGGIGVLLAVLSHWSIQHYQELPWFASAVMICSTMTLVSLNLTAGAYFSDFREKNPIKVASSQSATLTFLISILYMTVMVAIFFIPFNMYFFHALKGGEYNPQTLWFALSSFVVISAAISVLAVSLGLRTMKRDF